MSNRKMKLYYVFGPDGRMEYTEAFDPEQACRTFYDPNDFDPEEEFMVFEASAAHLFTSVPSSFKELKQ